MSAHVELRIERLIVDGLAMSGADAVLFRDALQTELGRLLAARGVPPGLHSGASIGMLGGESTAGRTPAAHPASLGAAAAGVVYRGIGR